VHSDREDPIDGMRPIEEVLAAHNEALLSMPGVVGTAIGARNGVPCVRVFLREADAGSRIPRELEGYLVETEVTGPFRARR
jgi:hypothetical protein